MRSHLAIATFRRVANQRMISPTPPLAFCLLGTGVVSIRLNKGHLAEHEVPFVWGIQGIARMLMSRATGSSPYASCVCIKESYLFKSLRLTNFKAWKDTGEISLAPVTMLLGTNSSGKSSLLQSLLLLKQIVRSPDRTIHLNLGGDEVNDLFSFGDFDSVLRQGVDSPRQFSIGFDFKRFDDSRVKAGSLETFYGKTSTGSVAVQQMKLNTDAREFRAVRRDRGAFSIFVDDEAQPRFKGRNYAPERSISFSADAIAELDQDGALAEDLSLSIRRELEGISDSASSVGSAHKAAGKLS